MLTKENGGLSPPILECSSRLFGHESVVLFVPSRIVIDLDDRISNEGILTNHAVICLFDSVFRNQDSGECLGDSGLIDAEVDHFLCELELEFKWCLCHKAIKIPHSNLIAIIIFNYFSCLTIGIANCDSKKLCKTLQNFY